MVWAAISLNGQVAIVINTGSLTAASYCDMLEEFFLPVAAEMFGHQNWHFIHDNAPPHTARLTRDMLEEHNIGVLDWPAMSPDLNLIENIWSILKQAVERRGPTNVGDLKKFILEEWNNIPSQIFVNLYASIRTRITKCIQAQGDSIDY